MAFDIRLLYSEALKLTQAPLLSLITLDLTLIGGPDAYRFVSTVDRNGEAVKYAGLTYTPMPIEIVGLSLRSSGQQARPTLIMSNFPLYMRQIVLLYRDLVGAKVSMINVFEKHLDGRETANPNLYFGPDVFFINKKIGEDRSRLEFELVGALDLEGIKIPVRTVQGDACKWVYRGDACLFNKDMVLQDSKGNNIRGFTGRFRGDWSSSDVYAANEGTRYLHSDGYYRIYRAKNAVAAGGSNPQTDSTNWQEVQRFRGEYSDTGVYAKNDVVWIRSARLSYTDYFSDTESNVRHYFIRNTANTATAIRPPHVGYWTQDVCYKNQSACSIHHDPQQTNAPLPLGSFPGTTKLPNV